MFIIHLDWTVSIICRSKEVKSHVESVWIWYFMVFHHRSRSFLASQHCQLECIVCNVILHALILIGMQSILNNTKIRSCWIDKHFPFNLLRGWHTCLPTTILEMTLTWLTPQNNLSWRLLIFLQTLYFIYFCLLFTLLTKLYT